MESAIFSSLHLENPLSIEVNLEHEGDSKHKKRKINQ